MQKIRKYILIVATLLLTSLPSAVAIPGMASAAVISGDCAATGNNANFVAQGANAATGGGADNCNVTTNGGSTLASLAKTTVNVLSLIVGIVAVIMIVYGGLRYVTSGGSSEGVGGAKNTIIYAIVGLIIVALAQLIVHFVLSSVSGAVSSQ